MPFLPRDQDLHLVSIAAAKRTMQGIFCHNYKVTQLI
jgi:hypothetical protein